MGGCKGCKDKFSEDEGVSPREFKRRCKKKHGTPRKAFDSMDQNGDGSISPKELAKGGSRVKPAVGPTDSKQLHAKLDQNGGGGIDPEEFYKIMGGCKTCDDKFGAEVGVP